MPVPVRLRVPAMQSRQHKTLQLPKLPQRCHYAKAKVKVHEYHEGATAVFHGPRRLADFDPQGQLAGDQHNPLKAA